MIILTLSSCVHLIILKLFRYISYMHSMMDFPANSVIHWNSVQTNSVLISRSIIDLAYCLLLNWKQGDKIYPHATYIKRPLAHTTIFMTEDSGIQNSNVYYLASSLLSLRLHSFQKYSLVKWKARETTFDHSYTNLTL